MIFHNTYARVGHSGPLALCRVVREARVEREGRSSTRCVSEVACETRYFIKFLQW